MSKTAPDEKLPALPIDWDEVESEATSLLQQYLRIDTTNPPGGEEAGVEFLARLLRAEGIEPSTYDAGDGRVSLSARLPGTNGAGTKPLILLSHIDVVPVEREYWNVDPYAGTLKDGVLWGRGALDMKGMGIMELLVFLLMRRNGVAHRRDVLLLCVADEEEASQFGMDWLAEHHPELLVADGVINEGAFGFGELLGQRGLIFGVAPTEKAPLWLKLVAKGRPGHGSLPHGDNAALRLIQCLGRIADARRDVVLRPETETTLQTLQDAGMLPADLAFRDPDVLKALAGASDLVRALVSNTVSLTTLTGGQKHNVIPARTEATLDCRLLPGEDVDTHLAELRAIVDDDQVEIEVIYRCPPLVSEIRTELLDHIEATIRHETAGGVVMPMISPGFTDSRIYRRHGVPAIGFTPVLLTTEEVGGVHGHDERISTANLRLGTQLLMDTVRRAAGTP
ncbi:MAG: M20/M25/M40 family metallo-hydrolase [Myxococcota bacterium]|nr:M20/M25/M40 family metallo-hydrolase [Myxococcota bacterium]